MTHIVYNCVHKLCTPETKNPHLRLDRVQEQRQLGKRPAKCVVHVHVISQAKCARVCKPVCLFVVRTVSVIILGGVVWLAVSAQLAT